MAESSPSRRWQGLHIAVVGAGVAGLCCARELRARGVAVTVFERESSVGGRLSCTMGDAGTWDGGAQFLTVQDETFAQEVRRWAAGNILRGWEGRFAQLDRGGASVLPNGTPRIVGTPSMHTIAEFLARDLDIVLRAPIGRISRLADALCLFDEHGRQLGITGFDGVVLAVPSVHAVPLLGDLVPFTARLASVTWDACWAAFLALTRPSGIEFDAAYIHDDPILAWVARDSGKPLRQLGEGVVERWVLQARSSWSNSFVQMDAEDAARWMQRAFAARMSLPIAQKACTAVCISVAIPVKPVDEPFFWDPRQAIGVCGDWCGGARVEAAFLSGVRLAQAITA
jgi:renalase